MQVIWSMMAWMMRVQVKDGEGALPEKGQSQGDVKMTGA
jgi:hypothetical protein